MEMIGPSTNSADRFESTPAEPLSQLLIRLRDRAFLVSADAIRWIEADDDFVILHMGEQSHKIRSTLAALHAKLDPQQFLRIHRSTVVNVGHIAELRICPGGEYFIVLQDTTVLKLSRTFRTALKQFGGMFGAQEANVC